MGPKMATVDIKASVKRCPICKSQAQAAYMPFCSKRCADIDLGKWFTSAYAIPGAEHDEEAESVPENGAASRDESDE
jgi:uncharacterized protein